MAGQGDNDSARRLGAELRSRRVARGLSLRVLAKQLGLSGHGTLVDYEHGRRIPPEDLIIGCERVFQVSDGALRNLREKALAERASRQADLLLADPPEPPAEPEPEPKRRRPRWRWLVVTAVVVLVAAGITFVALRGTLFSSARTVVAGWSSCWGPSGLQLAATDSPSYDGAKSLQITVIKTHMQADVSVCTAHGLETLHPGMKVTAYLRGPGPQTGDGVRFFVYDSHFTPLWAPETPGDGADMLLPDDTAWTPYRFTVPPADVVHTLGMEIYAGTARPVILWLGQVTW